MSVNKNVIRVQKTLGKWLVSDSKKFKAKHLTLCSFSDTGRGIKTGRHMPSGSLIVSIPGECLITSRVVLHSYLKTFLQQWDGDQLTAVEVLCLYLVYERHKGKQSSWNIYIESLPNEYTDCIHWSDDDVQNLPMHVKYSVQYERETFNRSFQKLQGFTQLLERDLHFTTQRVFTRDSYAWAWSTVGSRSVYMKQPPHPLLDTSAGDTCALAPFLDLLNHSDHAKVKAEYSKERACYEIYTLVSYKKNCEVFIAYGNHDNSKLMVNYGFVLPVNKHNHIPVLLDDVKDACQQCDITCGTDVEDYIRESQYHVELCVTMSALSWNLTAVVTAFVMSSLQKRNWKVAFIDENSDDSCAAVTRKVSTTLLQNLQQQYKDTKARNNI